MINTREIAAEYRLSHWSGIMRERNESGKSIKAYCETIGLQQNVYYYWQRKLREAACAEMPLAVVGNNEEAKAPKGWAVCGVTHQAPKAKDPEIAIEIGKNLVSATADIDMSKLRDVCQMLMSLC